MEDTVRVYAGRSEYTSIYYIINDDDCTPIDKETLAKEAMDWGEIQVVSVRKEVEKVNRFGFKRVHFRPVKKSNCQIRIMCWRAKAVR